MVIFMGYVSFREGIFLYFFLSFFDVFLWDRSDGTWFEEIGGAANREMICEGIFLMLKYHYTDI